MNATTPAFAAAYPAADLAACRAAADAIVMIVPPPCASIAGSVTRTV